MSTPHKMRQNFSISYGKNESGTGIPRRHLDVLEGEMVPPSTAVGSKSNGLSF